MLSHNFNFFKFKKNVFKFIVTLNDKHSITFSIMNYKSINFSEKYKLFSEQWKPKVISEINNYQFKIAKIQGEFIWHSHHETDEAFIVLTG